MTSRLTAAMEEAYASAPSNVVILHTLELNHASFSSPIRIVTGDEGLTAGELVALTLETGQTRNFTAMAFDVIPPGYDDDGPIPGRIRIDGVSGMLIPYLEDAAVSAGSISVTYRGYRSDARFEPGDVISGLKRKRVEVTATSVESEVGFDEVGQQAFPRVTYDIDSYPALFLGS
ncbi:DUF1833 family protein [Microvirga roseola]|uniref:DUF1833 family protein n=1 Tax=Microvirga roseola TaxID=2883126 RepID=UPI001E338FAE|nr:DUF1833 family protein [Microvirga roseola]